MLIILKTIFLLIIINFGNGILMSKFLKFKVRSFLVLSFVGMMSITFVETLIVFFLPLNIFIELGILVSGLFGVILFIKSKDYSIFDFRRNFDRWFYFFLIVLIFTGSFSPYIYDHFSYYSPTVSYLREFGFIKGISSFDLLLGQASFWHIYQAGFSGFVDVDLRLNTYLLLLFLIYIYKIRCWVLLLFFPFFLVFLQQPSPDLPVFIISLIVINELIEGRNNLFILCLSIFAFCIKPVVFSLPLLVILESIYTRNFRTINFIPITAFATLFIVKNIWLFGFPVFPVSVIDFNIPWKPNQAILTYSSQIGKLKSYDMKYSFQQISDFSFWQGVYHWFTIGFKSVFNMGIVLCVLILGLLAFRKQDRIYTLIFIAVLVKLVSIIAVSAQYRFFIDIYLITIFLIIRNLPKEKSVIICVPLSILILVIFIFPESLRDRYHMARQMTGFHRTQFFTPNQLKAVSIEKEGKIGNLTFHVSQDSFHKNIFPTLSLYNLKLYGYYGIFPQYLDNDLGQGFFQRKLTEEETIHLKKIIAETENYLQKFP